MQHQNACQRQTRRALTLVAAQAACLSMVAAAHAAAPAEVTLPKVEVRDTEDLDYVAIRSTTATKTDTPLIETPQAISVVTRDQMEAQGVQTLRQVTAWVDPAVQLWNESLLENLEYGNREAHARLPETLECAQLGEVLERLLFDPDESVLRILLQKQIDIVAGGGDPLGVAFDEAGAYVKFDAGQYLDEASA